jgi:hypothetical protein
MHSDHTQTGAVAWHQDPRRSGDPPQGRGAIDEGAYDRAESDSPVYVMEDERLNKLFDRLRGLPPEGRAPILAELVAGEPSLHGQLLQRLEEHDARDSVPTAAVNASDGPGREHIGPYRVLCA